MKLLAGLIIIGNKSQMKYYGFLLKLVTYVIEELYLLHACMIPICVINLMLRDVRKA